MGLLQTMSQLALGVNFLFLLLLGFSFLFLEPGTGPFVVATLTLIPVVLSLIASVLIIYTGWDPFE